MARQRLTQEVNKLVAGLVTEASPLTFPENASVDEVNFVLNRDGSRRRRLGIDYEDGRKVVGASLVRGDITELDISTFVWENVGGVPERKVLVVKVFNALYFFDLNKTPLSHHLIYEREIFVNSDQKGQEFSYAVVDGMLVVAYNLEEMSVFTWDESSPDSKIAHSHINIKVRDVFGVEDDYAKADLNAGDNINVRPTALTDQHLYNLRNQTWALPRLPGNDSSTVKADPIVKFTDVSGGNAVTLGTIYLNGSDWYIASSRGIELIGVNVPHTGTAGVYLVGEAGRFNPTGADVSVGDYMKVKESFGSVTWSPTPPPSTTAGSYPSNADNVAVALYADPNNSGDRLVRRFFNTTLINNPVGTTPAAKGYFIIDALLRGRSRALQELKLREQNPELALALSGGLPWDATPGGATAIAEFAGRMWYGGFSGELLGGDNQSPRLSSYVFFSKLVADVSDIGKCYQQGDPTSTEEAELLPTDGGFIRIDGAYGIRKLVNMGPSLLVLADNGVWSVVGGNDTGFDATNYLVTKITDHGCISSGSVVLVDSTVMYWGDDGIYHVATSELGDLVATSLTAETIATFYEGIVHTDKKDAKGIYDSFERKVRWMYPESGADDKELVLDLSLGAFYPNSIYNKFSSFGLQKVRAPFEVKHFKVGTTDQTYIDTREVMYLAISSWSQGKVGFSFAFYKDKKFKDWRKNDAAAFVVTGYAPGQDFQRSKQAPYVTFHLFKTETGFSADTAGVITPDNPSSCIVQSQWDWTNSANSNRWGTPFQAYRHKRLYMPSGAGDPYDDGNLLVSTKNKLRGKGKVVSLKISTEPEKDLHLVGMSSIMEVAENV